MVVRHSKLQLLVLRLYKDCLRAAQNKPGFADNIRSQFRRKSQIPKTDILTIEHEIRIGNRALKMINSPHVNMYTVGIRSSKYDDSNEEMRLTNLGAQFHRSDRGGLITFHGPGQLVVYPILHLQSFGPGVRWYVNALQETVIETCREVNVEAKTSCEFVGVWVGDKKVCALGIRGRQVTQHGIALNCNVDLTWFNHIVPCGIPDRGVTTLSQILQRNVTVGEMQPHFLSAFAHVFNCQVEEVDEAGQVCL